MSITKDFKALNTSGVIAVRLFEVEELLAHARQELDEELGVGNRVMAGTVAHAVVYDWLRSRNG